MTRPTILRPEVQEQVRSLGRADIVVGIPSFNNARTIGHVVRAVTFGLAKYFPDCAAVLVNSDGGSTDGTVDLVTAAETGSARTIFASHPVQALQKIVTTYQGVPGKGSALRTVFEVADQLQARACAVVDSDLRSISPEWVQLLLGPVLSEGFDYACPLYTRHKYDGTITNAIVYPLVRAAYGRRVRQPIGGDFGFSGRLAAHWLGFDVWESDVARYGIDIWMTTTALAGGFRVCQSYLGAKLHDAKDPGADLSAMLVQVTSALCSQLETHAPGWFEVTGSEPVTEFGFHYAVGVEPVEVNLRRMVDTFSDGVRAFDAIYRTFLSDETLAGLAACLSQEPAQFVLPVDLWVRIVYEYAAAFHHRRLRADHLFRSLTPLYLGRTAAWVVEAADYRPTDVEAALEALCLRFEALKPYLLRCWQEERRPA